MISSNDAALAALAESLHRLRAQQDLRAAAGATPASIIRAIVELVGPQRLHDALTPAQRMALRYFWPVWARPMVKTGPREYRGQILPVGDWRNALLLAGRGFGKALALDTPIPTPSGWTRMADIKIGDVVFDEAGRPCTVTAVFDVTPERAYRFVFSDGATLDACGDHQWVTWTRAERKAFLRSPHEDTTRFPVGWPAWRLRRSCGGAEPRTYPDSPGPRVRTSDEIAATLTHGPRGDTNHSIPTCGPLQLASRSLPVEPYLLGVWLVDGTSATNEVTIGALRKLGVLHDKHVPAAYLRASPEQRLALLQGLMDTDGSASAKSGSVEFCNTNRRLAEAVVELARSLGHKPVLLEGRVGPKYRVTWRPTHPVFRLPRKRRRSRAVVAQSLRNHHRMIVAARPIDLKPMRCITVDSPHALFLAGEGMIPTHNSRTGTEWAREKAEGIKNSRGALIGKTAPEARKILGFGASGIAGVCPPWNAPRWSVIDQCFEWPNGSLAFLFSADAPDSLRGHEFDWALFDEAAAARYLPTVWSNLQLALRRGPHPQCLITTTPRPLKWLRTLQAQPDTIVIRGTTFDNRANLPASFLDSVSGQFGGSALGRQELLGELLDEAEGAIWRRKWIDDNRVDRTPRLVRVAIGLDPSASSLEEHDECGIVAVGLGEDGHGYLLEDATMVGSPEQWARRAVQCFHDNEADLLVVENTRGGAMVESVIKLIDRNVKVKNRGAGASKRTRAEPIAAIAEQGRLHHVGDFDALENELTGWIPPEVSAKARGTSESSEAKVRSPNRMDAFVWAAAELLLKAPAPSQRGLNTPGKHTRRI